MQHKVAQPPCSDFVGVLLHDRPSLSYDEAAAVGRAMLQCAEHMANSEHTVKDESKLITYKDIAQPPKSGEPGLPSPPAISDMFDQPIGCVPFGAVPDFSEPGVAPYTGGFNLSALFQVVEHQAHTVQDMSSLVVDNAQFLGETMDEQDRHWYTHLPIDNNASSSGITDTTRAEFVAFSARNRNSMRLASEPALNDDHLSNIINFADLDNVSSANPNTSPLALCSQSSSSSHQPITAVTRNEFAAFSEHSRNLGRMTSEQALDYYLEQHTARPSQ